MSPNQRLMFAVALSIIFFVAYTAIFPPEETVVSPEQTKQTLSAKENLHTQTQATSQTTKQKVEAATGHAISAQDAAISADSSNILTVTSDKFILKMDTLGRISSMELLDERFRSKEENHAQLISQNGTKPLFLRFLDNKLNTEATSVAYTASVDKINVDSVPQKVTLSQKLSGLTITKEITFYEDGHYDVDVSLSQDKRYFIYVGQRPHVNEKEQMMAAVGALVYSNEDLLTIIEDGDVEGRKTFSNLALAAAFDQYNASIIYGFSPETNVIIERDREDNPVIYFEALPNMKFSGYIGPKDYRVLKSINPVLTNTIEYGWFTFASKPLFQLLLWLHGLFGNWGWAIVAMTLLIRAVLYPLTSKGMLSMAKMKDIGPEVKEIQAKYKDDKAKSGQAVMAFYQKKGVNPLGGCLPMLLQIPIFFAMYRVLLNAVELQGAPWMFWVHDLSRMDGTYVLPILMGASMYYQQKLTPNNFTDPMQEKVFKFLPLIFTFFFVTFPSGLVLYWFTNNLFSIAQQFVVNAQFKKTKDLEIALHKNGKKSDD